MNTKTFNQFRLQVPGVHDAFLLDALPLAESVALRVRQNRVKSECFGSSLGLPWVLVTRPQCFRRIFSFEIEPGVSLN